MRIYAEARVGHAWLLDARARKLEVELDLTDLWEQLPSRANEQAATYGAVNYGG